MSTSRASRARKLEREMGRKPGRPRERASLLTNPKRFKLATMCTLDRFNFGLAKDRAALATVIIGEGAPISIEMIERFLFVVVSARYGRITSNFDSVINQLVRDTSNLPKMKLRGAELSWLAHSAGCIEGIFQFLGTESYAGVSRALDMLLAAGWRETIESLCERIETALRGNQPPFDETALGRRGRKLLEILQEQLNPSGIPDDNS